MSDSATTNTNNISMHHPSSADDSTSTSPRTHTHTDTNTNINTGTGDGAMKIPVSPARASTLVENISQIQSRIQSTVESHKISRSIRLVAVSKLKPASDILALHSAPLPQLQAQAQSQSQENPSQLHFGENYVQELLEKSKVLPLSIRWHFIGGLQSNKAVQVARDVPSLWAVESCDTEKKARLLDKGRGEAQAKAQNEIGMSTTAHHEPLRVFVQVNTSGEESKSGVEPRTDELLSLCKLIRGDECPNLQLQGLMTIGAIARSKATTKETENEDFVSLRENRDWLVKKLGLSEDEKLELSMGMSDDFEGAIVQGSDQIRVGSTIFGERPPKKEAKVLDTTEEEHL